MSRQAIRDHSKILMGKNTMMRRCIRLYCERTGNDQWLQLLDHMIGNVGLIFTKGDLNDVRTEPVEGACASVWWWRGCGRSLERDRCWSLGDSSCRQQRRSLGAAVSRPIPSHPSHAHQCTRSLPAPLALLRRSAR